MEGARASPGPFAIALPPRSGERPSARDRAEAVLASFAPWLALYFGVQALGRPARPLFVGLPFEARLPVLEWSEVLYASGYVLAPLAPLLAPTRRALRAFVATGLLATLVVGALWLTIPVVAEPRPFVPRTFLGRLLAAERAWSAHVAAFPSFHVLWALIAADALSHRSLAWAWGAWAWAALVTLSCVTTGQHALADLVVAALLFLPIRHHAAELASRRAPSHWRLRKRYLDCTTEAGDAAIAYVGAFGFGRLQLPYLELLASGPGRPALRLVRLSGRARVEHGRDGIVLAAPTVGVAGRWQPSTPAVEAVLLDAPGATIRWRCEQPAGAAELSLPDGSTLRGRGYVEQLEITGAPWALPFDELRWGRFIGAARSVVWIEWRHGLERCWVFVDGVAVADGRVGPDRIEWPGGSLELEAGRLLREAEIGRSVAGPFAICLPRRVAKATESKWLSRARLVAAGSAPEAGQAIHEVVRWA